MRSVGRSQQPVVTVKCRGCGSTREVTSRQARRAGLCPICLYPPRYTKVTDAHKRFWLCRFTDEEIAVIATDMLGYDVSPGAIARHRAALDARRSEPA